MQDTILEAGVKRSPQYSSNTGEQFVLHRKKGHVMERLNADSDFDLYRRDSDIGPVVSSYSLLLAVLASS